ncbi:MAG: hypothetical protein RL272_684 [Candidatus Parcubacteria bacterium]|jgi:hypothetical protein
MRPFLDPMVRLLFSVPLAISAAMLARDASSQETGMESAAPRMLIATFACVAIAYITSSPDGTARGARDLVAGLAMATSAVASLSFAACLGFAALTATGFDVLTVAAMAFCLMMLAALAAILVYVISVITGVRAGTAAVVMACQVAPIAALIFEPHRVLAYCAAAAAATVAAHALFRLRGGKKE